MTSLDSQLGSTDREGSVHTRTATTGAGLAPHNAPSRDDDALHRHEPLRRDAGPRVAFQGELGAYADEAIALHWGEAAVRHPCRTFGDVVDVVAGGAADYAVLPWQNSIIGPIPGVADALERAALDRLTFVDVPIVHCLLAVPGASLEGLTTVSSHPAALAQCRDFLAVRPWISVVVSYDTSGSAKEVASSGKRDVGAIASASCASRYGLTVLASDIADAPGNTTRFVVLARPRA